MFYIARSLRNTIIIMKSQNQYKILSSIIRVLDLIYKKLWEFKTLLQITSII